MTNQEKYEKWLFAAEEDLITAEVLLNNGRYSYVAFMCQQSIEKLAKGLYVYYFGTEAPFTHNISIVLKDIESVASDTEYKEFELFFGKLTSYYIVARYDVYKQQIAQNLSSATCEELLLKAKEAFSWLKFRTK
jgi:HEPN domain-containing protein